MNITIPYKFTPREYQLPALRALDSGIKRAILVYHRRAGKDKVMWNFVIKKAIEQVGVYYYFLPTYTQAKKIIWDGMDKTGFKFLEHIPQSLIQSLNSTELKITLVNGSIIQLIGSDSYNSIVGTNPRGCVFSEYALQDPLGWEYVRPILAENGGWAIFVSTPRGRNHLWDLIEQNKNNPNWFIEILDVEKTKAISVEQIDLERQSGMSEELILQEFYVSFESSLAGAYYANQIKQAISDKRIGNVPYESMSKVDTWWDLGISDTTSIIFTQAIGKEIRIIDYYENSGEGIAHYAKVLQDKPYVYNLHYAPHDIQVRELGTGKSRWEVAKNLGIEFRIVPNISIEDGIEAVRGTFTRFWIDQTKCDRLIQAIKSYVKVYDEKHKIYKDKPLHNWASHPCDALRYLAVGFKEERVRTTRTNSFKPLNPVTGY